MKRILITIVALGVTMANAQSQGEGKDHDKENHGKGHAYGHYKDKDDKVIVQNKTVVQQPVVRKTTIVRPVTRTTIAKPVVIRTTVVPTVVRTRFVSAYPHASRIVWYRRPNSGYTANYYDGPYRTVTTYTVDGTPVETVSYIPVTAPPQPVVLYKQANPTVGISEIEKLLLPAKEPVYKLRTTQGTSVYVNESGQVVSL